MKSISIFVGAFCLAFFAAPTGASTDDFWENIRALCGYAYEGTRTLAPDDAPPVGSTVLHVNFCDEEQIQIRVFFPSDEDIVRIWTINRQSDEGLELRHDYRRPDGSTWLAGPGGFTTSAGTGYSQVFPSDWDSEKNLPTGFFRTIWTIEVHPGQWLAYWTQHAGEERLTRIEYDLTRAVEPPSLQEWEL